MKIERSVVEKLRVTDVPSLDPVEIILEDFGQGRGKVTMSCFGESWTAFWPSMAGSLKQFITSANNDYLANCFCRGIDSRSADESKDHEFMISHIKELLSHGDISDYEASMALDALKGHDQYDRHWMPLEVELVMCEPWNIDWPTMPSPKYEYLCRICNVLREVVNSMEE